MVSRRVKGNTMKSGPWKKLFVAVLAAMVLGACSKNNSGGNSATTTPSSNNWDSMNWDQGNWT
jgi:hypothetical protein